MASEHSPLLFVSTKFGSQHNPWRCSTAFSKRYRNTCVTTKAGLFVLVVLSFVNAVALGPYFYFLTTPLAAGVVEIFFPSHIYFMMELLMFPVVGLVGEIACKRYKLLVFGSVLIAVGAAIFALLYGLWVGTWSSYGPLNIILFLPFLLIVPGAGIFQSNALQYGVDQLDFPSSEVLSSFVYWYYWTSHAFIGPLVAFSIYGEFVFLTGVMCAAAVLLTCLLCLTIHCCLKNPYLRADPGHKSNPVILIWKVMCFVRRTRHPLLRSAFTYNEMPSRLDLAKQRYGGPFTTVEVEDVKSFWRILLVLVSLIGLQLQDDTLFTTIETLLFTQQFCSYYAFSTWTVSAVIISVLIPIYQFGIRPFFARHIPKMLTRMGTGLFVVLLALISTTSYNVLLIPATLSVYRNTTATNVSNSSACDAVKDLTITYNSTSVVCSINYFTTYNGPLPSLYWLVISQALNGLAHMLVFLTALEFILAQAPRTVQGILIGLWYAMQSINIGISIVGYSSCAAFHWLYYAIKSLLAFLFLLLFVAVACNYKYRQLNEDADINLHQEIENKFERNFDREEEYFQQQLTYQEKCMSHCIMPLAPQMTKPL